MTTPLTQQTYPEERRLATVMFADVQGFTTLADQMDFEEVGDLIRQIWGLVDKAIESFGGYIDKHIGDAVMSVWGAPHAREDDAERAVSAALALHRSLEEFTATAQHEGVGQLRMRVGINTGLVLAGYVGGRGEYTVLGDTVNIASRLETTADPGTTVIGESTYRLVRGAFRVRRLTPLQVKGKAQPLQAYLVEGALEQPGLRYRSMGGLETRMVGRDAEMYRLHELYKHALGSNIPVLAIVRGDEGIGKSRLLMEFTSQLSVNEPNVNILSSRSLAQANRAPFFVWKSLWQHRFGLSENDPPEVACEKFARGMQVMWGRQLGPVSALEAAHVIGALVGLEWPNSPFLAKLNAAPEARLERAYELTAMLLRRACAAGPVVIVLDDLHWADSGSLDLLEYLIEPTAEPLPLFIVAATRPGLLRKWRELRSAAILLSLKPLSIDADVVAAAYPAVKNLPPDKLTEIARVAEGNPYFMEEMVKSLTQPGTGPLMEEEHHLPDSLHEMLQARLDALTPEARNVALLASVVGRVFWVGAVVAAARQPVGTGMLTAANPAAAESAIADGLAQLVRSELAFPRAGSMFVGEQEYIFKHSVLRDVAYSLLPHKYRRQYHLAVARWLTKYATPDFAATIADHLEQAGAYPEAAEQYEQAARYAQSHGTSSEANWLQARAHDLRAAPPGTRPLTGTTGILRNQ